MGGTGLEPVTPSLSIWGSRSHPFAQAFAQTASLSGIRVSTERLSERERTPILAILATLAVPRRALDCFPYSLAACPRPCQTARA
jgi:hypothetical protein